jgi:hypothetical protein
VSRPLARLFPLLVLVVGGIYLAFGLMTASTTLGCDFLAYHGAAQRFLGGDPIYDLSITRTGECGIYQYPPPFVLLALPFSTLGFDAGNWGWIAFLVGCFGVGTALLPVRAEIRWGILLAGMVSWPFIFGVRIGQVGPILYLLFALGWRFLDRPGIVGTAIALGTLVKLQPAVVLGWLLLRRSWAALLAAGVTLALVVGVAALVGLGQWLDLATLLRNLSDALTVPTNLSLGATAYVLGAPLGVASMIQVLNTVAVIGLVAVAALRATREAGYLVAVVGSQVVSPIVWDHYALALLLPVAWLLERRQWWALAVPVVLAWVLLPVLSTTLYPLAFYTVLIGTFVAGWRRDGEVAPAVQTVAA